MCVIVCCCGDCGGVKFSCDRLKEHQVIIPHQSNQVIKPKTSLLPLSLSLLPLSPPLSRSLSHPFSHTKSHSVYLSVSLSLTSLFLPLSPPSFSLPLSL